MARMIQPTKGAIREERDKLQAAYQKGLLAALALQAEISSLKRTMADTRMRLIAIGSGWGVVTFFLGLLVGRIS